MLTTSLSRVDNFVRADFPNAYGVIKNFQLQNSRISFELQFYADKEAFELIQNPTSAPNMPENGGIVARRHFSEDVKVIEGFEPDSSADSLTEKLMSCCYQWLISEHYS